MNFFYAICGQFLTRPRSGDDEGDKPEPLILFEFKEPSVVLDDDAKTQLDNYEKLLNEKEVYAGYMVLSNGEKHLVRDFSEKNIKP